MIRLHPKQRMMVAALVMSHANRGQDTTAVAAMQSVAKELRLPIGLVAQCVKCETRFHGAPR